ncbi:MULTISPECIES: sensor histidine kinase [Paraburkholderia]|uniref:sensor histidine kinase n=1 Tax=Paraburkholderia TaxID=1822464 RepID=UPI0022575B2D|nr:MULTISPECIES: histidine kinase [Paraburkholderia]MCX4160898.1 histidine kinase [Paraburkholderia megapolitana]MDN7156394.1 histidine kinase [Paraburkholderia sp. CHISQ3]MDQ6493439.1 histidine kinase [Paraburkholderia megapolitana]
MNTNLLVDEPQPIELLRRLVWPWVAFWLLIFAVDIQQSMWSGELQFWRTLVNTSTSALGATVLIAVQMGRRNRRRSLLGQPLKWFLRAWAWMPLQLVVYVTGIYALRLGIYALAGSRYRHGPWGEVFAYDATAFVEFYVLFSGIIFGIQSYGAWAAERVRSAQQANLARQAQLAQLTQQLQPHFLFNALNTISSLIHSNPDSADRLLTQLATLLRAATDASQRPEQSLADELTLLHAYADIMTQRFSDRVRITWDVDAATSTCLVPTLGLQPLLENCFRHVVERRSAPTHIAIRARHDDTDKLQIEIEDDGETLGLPDTRGVGLGNLEGRLQSLYGTQASLALQLRPGGGLIVRVTLPCAH